MDKIKVKIDVETFPEEIRYLLENTIVYDSSCHSGAKVYYLESGYYIKVDKLHNLANEAYLNKLFNTRGLGVEVIAYISTDKDYLVTRSADGQDLIHCLAEPEKVCEILADALKKLHAQPVNDMPISERHKNYKKKLGDDYPFPADTLIHGDACLPNIIYNHGEFHTFIDCALAGVGNRHIDLYWAIWSLKYNLETDTYKDYFLDLYGRENVNEDLLQVMENE